MLWLTLEELLVPNDCFKEMDHHNHVTMTTNTACNQLQQKEQELIMKDNKVMP